MSAHRIAAIVRKDLAEIRYAPGVLVPPLIMATVSIVMPFLLAVLVPLLTGEGLSADDDLRKIAVTAAMYFPALADLPPDAAVQALIFQQFLLFFVLIPVTAAMAIATYSVIGEKQARTLEPLLASPLTTTELLLAKVVSSTLPALIFEVAALVVYFLGILFLAMPGVAAAIVTVRTAFVVLLLGPLAALVALQLGVITSSRVNDPRSAQQIGVLVILPIIGLMIAQFTGVLWLTSPLVLAIAVGLAIVWLALLLLGVRLFDRESILTRWN